MLYGHVRHPLYIGWMLAFWATPTMTVGHLLFAGVLSAYMVLAAMIEERDLVAHFGLKYTSYQRRVPAFVPWPRRETLRRTNRSRQRCELDVLSPVRDNRS